MSLAPTAGPVRVLRASLALHGLCGLAAMVTVAVGLGWLAPAAAAAPPRPLDLQVRGGENAWRPENSFSLRWADPPQNVDPPLVDTRFRIQDAWGATIDEFGIGRVRDGIGLEVPRTPGAYTVEVWFEDAAGNAGPAAMVTLRFDDTRPAPIEPLPPQGWIGRTSFPLRIRIGHPSGPAPIAGIRGYAVAIDAAPGHVPCTATDRCTETETTLRGGADEDTLTIPALPEGASYLNAVAVSGSGMKSATSRQTALRVDTTDPLTRLIGVPAGWTNQAVSLIATATDSGSGMEQSEARGPSPFTAIRIDDGAPTIGYGAVVTATVIAEGEHLVSYFASDAAGNVDDGGSANGIVNRQPRTAWVRIDRAPPTLAFPNSQDPRDPDLVRVRVVDRLAGPDLSRGWIGVRRVGTGDRFDPLPAAPAANGELRARWDSDAYPRGEYEFEALAYDAAGNAAVATQRRNGTPMILSNPLKTTTTLSASFGARHGEAVVRYGHGLRCGGRLATAGGKPLAGMPVRIVERFARGSAMADRVSTARTQANGRFSLSLAPGPSREVTAAFAGTATLSRVTSDPLRLGVRSAVRLQASAAVARVGGAPLVFRGAVTAAPGAIGPGGTPVQLQFRLPGLPWAEFRTVQTDGRGRFHYAYRFSDDDSRGARFQFRAYVPPHDDWPYEPGSSRPIVVRGR